MDPLLLSEIFNEKNNTLVSIALIEEYIFASNNTHTVILDDFVKGFTGVVDHSEKTIDKAEKLINAFLIDHFFIEQPKESWSVNSHQLGLAIIHKSLTPPLKAMLFVHLANYYHLKADVIFISNKIMVRVVCENNNTIIFDPIDGSSLNWIDLLLVAAHDSNEPLVVHVDIMSRESLLLEYIHSVHQACIREKRYTESLRCSDLLLSFGAKYQHLVKDNGILSHQLEYFLYVDKTCQRHEHKNKQLLFEKLYGSDSIVH